MHRTLSYTILLVLGIALAGCRNASLQPKGEVLVYLQPYDEADMEATAFVAKGIADSLPVRVKVLPQKILPQSAWYAPRKRFMADSVLRYMSLQRTEQAGYLLGITGKDISTLKNGNPYWGVMGLGFCPGNRSIVSDYRLQKYPQTEEQLHLKLLKVALHELGHNFGLPHCPHTDCLMADAEGKDRMGQKRGFCSACKKYLEKI